MTAAAVESFANDRLGEAPVRGFLHRATPSSSDALVLTHGASGNSNSPLLVALADAFASSGLNVLRCDLPFRQLRPHGPPSPANSQKDQEGLRRAVMLLKERFAGRLFLGGQSYGGRQASLLAASRQPRNPRWLARFCCSRILCIPPAAPPNYGRHTSLISQPQRCSSAAPRMRSAPSRNWKQPST